jgi:hypothetical protein
MTIRLRLGRANRNRLASPHCCLNIGRGRGRRSPPRLPLDRPRPRPLILTLAAPPATRLTPLIVPPLRGSGRMNSQSSRICDLLPSPLWNGLLLPSNADQSGNVSEPPPPTMFDDNSRILAAAIAAGRQPGLDLRPSASMADRSRFDRRSSRRGCPTPRRKHQTHARQKNNGL